MKLKWKEVSAEMDYQYIYDATLFGKRMQEIRKKKKITQEKLAEMLSLSVDSVSKMENGKITCMPDHFIKICQIFNVSADYFYFGREEELCVKQETELDTIIATLKNCSSFDVSRINQMINILLSQPAA